uniref:NPR1_3 protein n=1 Tax=Fopius arisanus TaxID=64838 RepID=A0A0C9PWJ7_9HYME
MASRWIAKLTWAILLVISPAVNASCRDTELPRDCEALCIRNQTTTQCELRAAVLLPKDTRFEISLTKVLPVLDLAVSDARRQKLLPDWLKLTFILSDDRCDATYAQIAAIDSYANCVHLFLGPACDYCVANVGRVVKFLNAPLLTTGGFTIDFTNKKTECSDEYYMTTRIGSVGFRDIGLAFLAVMDRHNWKKVHLIYDPMGQTNIAGEHTCQLMMKSMVALIKKREDITFGNFDIETYDRREYGKILEKSVGNFYSASDFPC